MSVAKKLAVLIDAENISPTVIKHLFTEIHKLGNPCVKRIYGDWTDNKLNQWKNTLKPYAINPIQQFSYVSGKNATDMALVIDAMDLLHQRYVDGFCLVSSDSDFTRLASRIRENGLVVFGFGQKQTTEAFINACDQFIPLKPEHPSPEPIPTSSKDTQAISTKPKTKTTVAKKTITTHLPVAPLILQIQSIIQTNDKSNTNAWINADQVRSTLNKILPKFKPADYGFKQFDGLIQSETSYFEWKKSGKLRYIRLKIQSQNNTNTQPSNPIVPKPPRWTTEQLNNHTVLVQKLHQAITQHADSEGWANLSAIASTIGKDTIKPLGYAKTHVLFSQIKSVKKKQEGRIYFFKII